MTVNAVTIALVVRSILLSDLSLADIICDIFSSGDVFNVCPCDYYPAGDGSHQFRINFITDNLGKYGR